MLIKPNTNPFHLLLRLSGLTVGFEKFVDVGKELQQPVEVVLGGAALQHSEEQHGGLALHPLQGEPAGGRRAAISQLDQQRRREGRLERMS